MKFMIQCIKILNSLEVLTLERVFVIAGNREFGSAGSGYTMKSNLNLDKNHCR